MSTCRACVVVLAVISLVACAAQQARQPAVDLAMEEQAIRDASAAWLAAVQARDAVTIDGLMAADITTIFDGKVDEGVAAVQASRDKEWADQPDATVDWTTEEVGVAASGDLGYERGYWTSDPDGAGEEPPVQGVYLTVWKKIDGQWKALYDTGTVIRPEEGPENEEPS